MNTPLAKMPVRLLAIMSATLWLPFVHAFATFDLRADAEFFYGRYSDLVDEPIELRDEVEFIGTLAPNTDFPIVVAAEATDNISSEVVARYGDGWIRIVGTAVSVIAGTPEGIAAEGGGEFQFFATIRDTVTITAPGRPTGTSGTASVGVLADGVLSAATSSFGERRGEGSRAVAVGDGSVMARFTAVDTVSVGVAGDVISTVFPDSRPPALGFQDEFLGGSLNFLFGVPIDVEIQMRADGRAGGDSSTDNGALASAVIVVDFGRTVTWAGVGDLRDAEGVAVADFSALSSTGVDFRHAIVAPVPVPAAMPMMVFGLTWLGLRRLRVGPGGRSRGTRAILPGIVGRGLKLPRWIAMFLRRPRTHWDCSFGHGTSAAMNRHIDAASGKRLLSAALVRWMPLLLGLHTSAALAFNVQLDGRLDYQFTRDSGDSSFEAEDDFRVIEMLVPERNYGFVLSAAGGGLSASENVSTEIVARHGVGWVRVAGTAVSALTAAPPATDTRGEANFEFLAHILDEVTIDAPGLTGSTGSASLGVLADGALSASGLSTLGESGTLTDGIGGIIVTLTGVSTVQAVLGHVVADRAHAPEVGVVSAIGFDNAFLGGTLEFTYGVPITIDITLGGDGDTSAFSAGGDNGGAPATSVVVIDFGHTLTWAGVEDVRDAVGNPVTGFTALSSAGADFRQAIAAPVPLPPSWLLSASAVLCAYRLRARRSTISQASRGGSLMSR